MDYTLDQKDAFRVIGVRKTTEDAGGVWGMVKSDGGMNRLEEAQQREDDSSILSLCFGFDEEGHNDNMVGYTTESEAPIPENQDDWTAFDYPESSWVTFVAEGKISEDFLWNTWQYIHKDFLINSGFIQEDLPTSEEYDIWDEEADYGRVTIRIAVKPLS